MQWLWQGKRNKSERLGGKMQRNTANFRFPLIPGSASEVYGIVSGKPLTPHWLISPCDYHTYSSSHLWIWETTRALKGIIYTSLANRIHQPKMFHIIFRHLHSNFCLLLLQFCWVLKAFLLSWSMDFLWPHHVGPSITSKLHMPSLILTSRPYLLSWYLRYLLP